MEDAASDALSESPAQAAADLEDFALAPTSAVYEACTRLGIQWGSSFRTMERVWVSDGRAQAVSHLRWRSDFQGTGAHPADIDGALQVNWVLQQWSLVSATSSPKVPTTLLPIALDASLVRGSPGALSV